MSLGVGDSGLIFLLCCLCVDVDAECGLPAVLRTGFDDSCWGVGLLIATESKQLEIFRG